MEEIAFDYINFLTVDIDQFTYVTNFYIHKSWNNVLMSKIYNMTQLKILIYPCYIDKRIINLQKLQRLECEVFYRNEQHIQIGINIMNLPDLMLCKVSSFRYAFKKIIERNKCYGFILRYKTSDYYLAESIYTLSYFGDKRHMVHKSM